MATDRLGDMRLFVEAATLGSLSAAGRKLNLSPAAASARLSKLEAALNTRLFNRTTRKLRLTAEGQLYLQQCRIALQAFDDAQAVLQTNQGAVRGKIRISAPSDFGRNLLGAWLDEFCALHPDVRIALSLSDSVSNLMDDDIDLAIRFGIPGDSSLVARRLAPNWRLLCASPEYLARKGEPETLADLAAHQFIVLTTAAGPLNEFHFLMGETPLRYIVPMDLAWETNDGAMVRAWMLAGRGIARKTVWDAVADVRVGALKIVLPASSVNEAGVHAVFHGTRYMPLRVRLLLDFLAERFRHATDELLREIDLPRQGEAGS